MKGGWLKWAIGAPIAAATACGLTWLALNRAFIDPTAISSPPDALSAQAAWIQALLSVLAVFVAIFVAERQAKESRRLSEEQHEISLQLIRDERSRVEQLEQKRAEERRALAFKVLDPVIRSARMLRECLRNHDQGWVIHAKAAQATAEEALGSFNKIESMLAVTAQAALHCYVITEALEEFKELNARALSGLREIPAHGMVPRLVYNPEASPLSMDAALPRVEGELDRMAAAANSL